LPREAVAGNNPGLVCTVKRLSGVDLLYGAEAGRAPQVLGLHYDLLHLEVPLDDGNVIHASIGASSCQLDAVTKLF